MNTKTIRAKALPLAALALAVPLALSACGGAGDPAEGETPAGLSGEETTKPTFLFTDSDNTVSGEEITLELPSEVDEVNSAYAKGKILNSVAITGLEVTDNSHCAISYKFDYADGGLNRAKSLKSDQNEDTSADEYESVADALYFSTIAQDKNLDINGGRGQLSNGITKASGELSDDYRSAVALVDCASAPGDDASTATVTFPYRSDNADKVGTGSEILATAEIAVQEDGTVSIASHETKGLRISSDGTVIENNA